VILQIEIIDPKAALGVPGKQKAVNTRYIAEIDPIYQPASDDDATPIQVGTELVMHSGKRHRTSLTLTQIMTRMGGRA
jgi:hypothetical protein